MPQPREWDVEADRLSAEAYAQGRPTGWFDELWAAGEAGEVTLPWDREEPNVLLRQWAVRDSVSGAGKRAVVVGCGLGADAEYVASLGFATTGFDISPTAVRLASGRHRDSGVTYQVADLLDLPAAWHRAFDLVVEVFTLQALPDPPRAEAAAGVRSLVAAGGVLLAVQLRHDGSRALDQGPPFSQPRRLFETTLAQDGLELVALEELPGPLWRAELRRTVPTGEL